MPVEGIKPKQHEAILSYEEIILIVQLAAKAGINRIRLTGGEPLVRKGVVRLVKTLTQINGIQEVSMTTNGILLKKYAASLYEAGLRRINISLDSLDPQVYHRLTRWGRLEDVLAGIEAALAVGMNPVKINVVVLRGINDNLEPFAALTKKYPVHVRFIEYMPAFYESNGDKFISGEELEAKIRTLNLDNNFEAPVGAGPARYFKIKGALGTIGLIGSSKGHFCQSCNRLRLTADGKLRTCLFSNQEIDLLPIIRSKGKTKDLLELITKAIKEKPKDRFARKEERVSRLMSQIGG